MKKGATYQFLYLEQYPVWLVFVHSCQKTAVPNLLAPFLILLLLFGERKLNNDVLRRKITMSLLVSLDIADYSDGTDRSLTCEDYPLRCF